MIPFAPFLVTLMIAILHHGPPISTASVRNRQWVVMHVTFSLFLTAITQALLMVAGKTGRDHFAMRISLLFFTWWRFLGLLLAKEWPKIFFPASRSIHGGPLGEGYFKLCDCLTGLCLWTISHHSSNHTLISLFPPYFYFGPLPKFWIWAVVFIFSLVVNIVLESWSVITRSRGSHSGVERMVNPSVGRNLTVTEHIYLLFMASTNAFCEEMTSRVLWRSMFEMALSSEGSISMAQVQTYSNITQAAVFGLWHYYGIPNGWTGVILTFVYGLLMGALADATNQSLWMPLVAHTLADYYIFAFLARNDPANQKRSS